jgi:hypothetical protein
MTEADDLSKTLAQVDYLHAHMGVDSPEDDYALYPVALYRGIRKGETTYKLQFYAYKIRQPHLTALEALRRVPGFVRIFSSTSGLFWGTRFETIAEFAQPDCAAPSTLPVSWDNVMQAWATAMGLEAPPPEWVERRAEHLALCLATSPIPDQPEESRDPPIERNWGGNCQGGCGFFANANGYCSKCKPA